MFLPARMAVVTFFFGWLVLVSIPFVRKLLDYFEILLCSFLAGEGASEIALFRDAFPFSTPQMGKACRIFAFEEVAAVTAVGAFVLIAGLKESRIAFRLRKHATVVIIFYLGHFGLSVVLGKW